MELPCEVYVHSINVEQYRNKNEDKLPKSIFILLQIGSINIGVSLALDHSVNLPLLATMKYLI
jgi:hypothetical protein